MTTSRGASGRRRGDGVGGRPEPTYLDSSWEEELRRLLTDGASPMQLEDFRSRALAESAEAERALPEEIRSLRDQVLRVDALRLVGAIDVFDAIRRTALSGHANFGSDAMVELLGGIVASANEVHVLRHLDEQFDPNVVWETDAALKRIANLQLKADLNRMIRIESADRFGLMNMLQLEHRFDRMAGFDSHVRHVISAVFKHVDDRCRATLGFRLSDSLRFAHLYNQVRMLHVDKANEYLDTSYPPYPREGSPEERLQWKAGHMVLFALTASPHLEGNSELEAHLAERLGIEREELSRLLVAMGTRVGSVSEDQLAADNPLRHSPILTLSTGEWMWSRPVDFLHGSLEWAAAVCLRDDSLMRAFDRARQQVAEQLPVDLLRQVFGAEHVHDRVTYPASESDAEADVLVVLPGVALVVECKGGRFSREGRRGAPRRVERHIKDLADRADSQNARTIAAIREGKKFRVADGSPLELDARAILFPVTVTLERIDPFSAYLSTSRSEDDQDRSWILCLADLVLLATVLESPSDFIAYVQRRREMLNAGARVFVEADALGAWCEDRLTTLERQPDPFTGGVVDVVSRTSAWMNDYFTVEALTDFGAPEGAVERYAQASDGSTKPNTQVPEPCRAALDRRMAEGTDDWLDCCIATLTIPPKAWRPLTRLIDAAARSGGQPTNKGLAKKWRKAGSGMTLAGQVYLRLTVDSAGQATVQLNLPEGSSNRGQ